MMFLKAPVPRVWITENDAQVEGFMFKEYDCY